MPSLVVPVLSAGTPDMKGEPMLTCFKQMVRAGAHCGTAALLMSAAVQVQGQEATRGGNLNVLSITAINSLNPAIQSGVATGVPAAQLFASLLQAAGVQHLTHLKGASPGALRDKMKVANDVHQLAPVLPQEDVLRDWYVTRFFSLRDTAFRDPKSYFHRYASLTDKEARATASRIWETINLVNLRENVLPTRQRADLILRKGADHIIHSVWLRKL